MSFEGTFELNSPMSKEDWDKLTDVELEKTKWMDFTTPCGRKVRFYSENVFERIEKEIWQQIDNAEIMGCPAVQYRIALGIVRNCMKGWTNEDNN